MKRQKSLLVLIAICIAAFSVYSILSHQEDDLDEFAAKLQHLIDKKRIADNIKSFAEKPHRAGTAENHAVADRIIQELRESGANVWTTEHIQELPERGSGSLIMTFPVQQQISYQEKSLEQDPYSRIASDELPFFAYAPDGEVEGEVIYANFGDRQDYAYLESKGIEIAGKIALIRAQGSCRGMKQMVAEEQGLAGILLYPEPKDQGFKKPAYPEGPSINPWLAQRGSMLKFFLYPGDPYTKVQDRQENTLPTVPALPITPEAANTIFKYLNGETNESWKGWMGVSYSAGPGPVRLKLQYNSSRSKKKIRNVFATIGGTNSVDPVLLVSTHYDAWIYGASDPGSGTAVVLEAAKALLALQKDGWKPKQDIVFAFWDGEEYGMMGSTRWVLDHLRLARDRIASVIYIDSVRGPMFRANILPGLRGILDQVLTRFKDPNTGKSVLEFHLAHDMPGYSDDTIPFSNFAGVPIAQLNYGPHYTMYHSIYDNPNWMEKFGDPNYSYVANLSGIVSLYSIALTREERLPFRFGEFAAHYLKELSKIRLESMKGTERDVWLNETVDTIKSFGFVAQQFDDADFTQLTADRRERMNQLLLQAIQTFTEMPGTAIPFRLRNVVAGSSTENECAGTDMPGVRRALQIDNNQQLKMELERLQDAFTRSMDLLLQATALVKGDS